MKIGYRLSTNADNTVREGIFDAAKIGFSESYLSALIIFLGASPIQVGMLSTLPPLVSAICQSMGVQVMELWKSRRRLLVTVTRAQSVMLVVMAFLAFFSTPGPRASTALIVIAIFYYSTIGMSQPVWNSLVGDLIVPESRGMFFGTRNRWMAISTFCSMLIAGQILSWSKTWHWAALGFSVILLIAAASRWSSSYFSTRLDDPHRVVPPQDRFSFWQFVSRWKHSNFVRFVFFVGAMQLAVNVSGPYLALYMLRDLHMSYSEFTAVGAALIAANFLVMRSWGKISDQFGNRKILVVCGSQVAFNPLLWLVSSNVYWLIFVQFYSGIFWAGFNIAAAGFVFDAVTPQKIGRCFAYQAIVIGVLVCCGSLCGGWLAENHYSSAILSHGLFSGTSELFGLFVLSGMLRLAAVVFLLPRFREVRPSVKYISHRDMCISVVSLRPVSELAFSILDRIPRPSRRRR